MERTLSIIKPDATTRNITGKINTMIEEAGLKIVAQKMIHMSKEQAQKFYIQHQDRPFYENLVNFMSSAQVVVQVLEGENVSSDPTGDTAEVTSKKARKSTKKSRRTDEEFLD